MQIGEKTSKYN